MSREDLPSEFDIVVLGTGLTETVVAAAFSRIGLKVLHLDRNGFYGGSYANFSLQGIEEWEKDLQNSQQDSQKSEEEVSKLLNEGEALVSLPSKNLQTRHIKKQYNVRHRTAEEIEAAKAVKASKTIWYTPPDKTPSDLEELDKLQKVDSEQEETTQNTDNTIEERGVSGDTETSVKEGNAGQKCQAEKVVKPSSEENVNSEPCTQGSLSSSNDSQSVNEAKNSTDDSKNDANSSTKDEDLGDDQVKAEDSEQTDSPSLPTPSAVKEEWTVEGIEDEGRRFCFDLSPRVLYCSGDLVELLIRSDVSRYCEFRTVSRVLTVLKGSLEQVPCSRADVFSSKIVSLIEKRLMMKFMQFALDYESSPEEYKDYIDKPFHEFLSSKKLSVNVKQFVQNAIAMVGDTATTAEGLRKTQLFLRSLGRYGNTAFLFPLYGSGELPQSFSRLSAVFGGVYCLMLRATHVITNQEEKCCGIVTSSGQRIACRYLVGEANYLPSSFMKIQESNSRTTSRAIFITDKSIHPSDEDELSLLNFVCEDDRERRVTVLELPYSASVCPKGAFLVHLTRESNTEDAMEKDFAEVTEKLFGDGSDETKPNILWTMYFNQPNLSEVSLSENATENVLVTSAGGDATVDLERIVDEAKAIFYKVCPEEEFLAKPPNPEDIILIDDVETSVAGKSAEEDAEGDKQEQDQKDNTGTCDEIAPQEILDSTESKEKHEEEKSHGEEVTNE